MNISQINSLENENIKIEYNPKNGGMITSLIDKSRNHEWVWYKDDNKPFNDNDYDKSWKGGWEELFPCDFNESFSWGKARDHGELWGRNWSIVEKGKDWVELSINTYESKTVFNKKFKLFKNKLYCEYSAAIKFDDYFLFKLHLAIPNENNIIKLEKSKFLKVDESFGNISDKNNFKSLLLNPQSNTKLYDFFYVYNHNNLVEIINEASNSKMILTFDKKIFPYFWLFQSQGGWMNKNTTVLEPATNSSKLIEDAVHERAAIKGPIKNFVTWYEVELLNV